MKIHEQNSGCDFLGFLAVLIACITGTASADDSARQKYPWDMRPPVCMTEQGTSHPGCISEDWPSFEESIRRITFLYNAEQFILLEQGLADLTKLGKTFISGASTASAAYWAFRQIMPAPGTPENAKDRITRWKAAIPSSYFAVFAEARYLYGNAWNIRGAGYAGSVSPESWELFALRLREAEQKLLNAPDKLKNTPLWDNLLFAIALDSREVKSDPKAVFENGVKRWPRYFDLYEVMLTRLVPKWGGSWDMVESFVDKWSLQQKSTEGASMYARLYISLLSQGVSANETAMDWARMNSSLDDLTTRYPDPKFKNLHASYACVARDKASFSKAMSRLPNNELMANNWLSGHSYEACARWAGI